MIHVLFVCLGNICRSPMAEAVFRQMVTEEGLQDKIQIDSAGTAGYHIGSPPHEGTRNKLDASNIPYDTIKGRQIEEKDFQDFDYIIAMDQSNMHDLRQQLGNSKAVVAKIMDFVKDPLETDVPDPYYTGNFDYTYELVSDACKELLTFLKEKII